MRNTIVEEEDRLQAIVCLFVLPFLAISVHEPSVSEVATEVASVVPVGPPVAPCAYIGLPDRVLDNAQVVSAILALAGVQGKANDVWLWAES